MWDDLERSFTAAKPGREGWWCQVTNTTSVIEEPEQASWQKMQAALPLYATLMITTSIGAVGANLLLLTLFASYQKLRTDTWALSLNLSLCDMVLGISIIPIGIYTALSRGGIFSESGTACRLLGSLFVLVQVASLNSLVWATVDKFAEICFPLRYTQLITKKRIWFVLAFLWIYALVVATLPFMGFGDYSFSPEVFMCLPTFSTDTVVYSVMLLTVGVLAPITGISVLYIAIIHIARYQARRGTFVCNDQHCYYVPIRSYFRNTIILIVSASYLLACWLPSIIIAFYEIFYARNVPGIVKMIATWLILLTSGLNPWINSLAQRKYRKAIQTSWRKLKQICENVGMHSDQPSDNERHSSIQSHQCLPGNNTTTSVQT